MTNEGIEARFRVIEAEVAQTKNVHIAALMEAIDAIKTRLDEIELRQKVERQRAFYREVPDAGSAV